jgi:hypothetical protein
MSDYIHILQSRLTGNASRVAWFVMMMSGSRTFYPKGKYSLTQIIADWLEFDKLTIKKSLEELERFQLAELERLSNGQIVSIRLICYAEYTAMQDALEELKRHARG